MYARSMYESDGRNVFTAKELISKTGLQDGTVHRALQKCKTDGFVLCNEHPVMKCGSLECVLKETLWSITELGANYAADRVFDFEPHAGEYIMKTKGIRDFPACEFTLEFDDNG